MQMIKDDHGSLDDEVSEKIWELIPEQVTLPEDISDRIFGQTMAKIGKIDGELVKAPKVKNLDKGRNRLGRWLAIAASLALLLGIFGWYSYRPNSETVVRTAFGEKQDLQLADGSKVKLNANTKMVYDRNWSSNGDREVYLEGEAFFEVTKKPETGQRFKVNTNAAVIEVLGTSFNVNSYGDRISVYLEEGQIKLHLIELDSVILMKPGDLIVYRESDGQLINKHEVETEYHTSWKNGVLIFRASPLSEVLRKIEETYGVDFEVADTVNYNREINFPLPIDRLETAISILNKTMGDLEIKKIGDKYIIR